MRTVDMGGLSLGARAILSVFLAIALTFPIFIYIGTSNIQDAAKEFFVDRAISLSRMLDANVRNETELRNRERLWDNLQKTIWLSPDVLWIDVYQSTDSGFIEILTTNPAIKSDYETSEILSSLPSDQVYFRFFEEDDGERLRLVAPIHQGRQVIGAFEIWMTLEDIENRETNLITVTFVGYTVFLLFFVRYSTGYFIEMSLAQSRSSRP